MEAIYLNKELIYTKLCKFIINFKQNTKSKLYFASHGEIDNLLSYKTNAPRFELVLGGVLPMVFSDKEGGKNKKMRADSALFIDKNAFNLPLYEKTAYAENMSFIFGHNILGISYIHWQGGQFIDVKQLQIPRKGPRIASHIINALSEFELNISDFNTARCLFIALITHIEYHLKHPPQTLSRKDNLYSEIITYIQNNSHKQLNRMIVAEEFGISPDYISHLFHEKMRMGFKETLTYYRLEKAKSLLKLSNLKIIDIARLSGFCDGNYFCRLFKKETQRTPTEYRNQYLSSFD